VIIIGVITLVASVLLLLLPETMATKLPDTIEEVEDKYRTDNSDINSLHGDEAQNELMTQQENRV
jgi:hypothetical protein